MRKHITGWSFLVIIGLCCSPLAAETITITTSADSGTGSFREAVAYSNTATGVQTIDMQVPSPITLSASTITISQPVIINGHGTTITSTGSNEIRLSSSSSGSIIRDLVLTKAANYNYAGLRIESDYNTITGCVIGTDWIGSPNLGNRTGLYLSFADHNIIGGSRSDGNIISGNTSYGIYLDNSHHNAISGNTIGLAPNELTERSNQYGIRLYSSDYNSIGLPGREQYNIISGNSYVGIYIYNSYSNYNVIQNNRIGLIGTSNISSSQNYGIYLNSNYNLIGSTNPAAKNIISGNSQNDILICADSNTIIGNFIGTNLSGSSAVGPSSTTRISLEFATKNLIGLPYGQTNNLIAGGSNGIYLGTSSSGNGCYGNTICGYTDLPIKHYSSSSSQPVIRYPNTDRIVGNYASYYYYNDFSNYYVEVYRFTNNTLSLLGYTTADSDGNWSIAVSGLHEGDYVCTLGVSPYQSTSGFSSPTRISNNIRAPTPTPTPDLHVNIGQVKVFNNILYTRQSRYSDRCVIRWQQPHSGRAVIRILDENGQQIRMLRNNIHFNASEVHDLSWDGSDDKGQTVGSGMYYVHVLSKNMNTYKKIMVISK